MFKQRDDYPLATWMIDLCEIIKRRQFMDTKTVLLMLVEDIEELIEMYEEGESPQSVYKEMFE